MIVVVAILVALVLITLPTFEKVKNSARQARAMGEIRGIEKAIGAYAIDHDGKPPNQLEDLNYIDLVVKNDPWGRRYEYHRIVDVGPGRWGTIERLNSDYDLYSVGADGQTEPDVNTSVDVLTNADDIVRAGDGEYVGMAKYF